jgi:NitT/TauT family transport system permease protein
MLTRILQIPTYLLPTPFSVVRMIISEPSFFAIHAATTFTEAFLGWLLAAILGCLFASLFALCRPFEQAALPIVLASQAVPIVAVAPLLILWLGDGLPSKIAMATMICIVPVTLNAVRGFDSFKDDQLAVMLVLGSGRWQIFKMLRIPASVPFILSGLKISASFAMIGAIVAEYAGASQGLGYLIMQATYRLDTVRLFAGISLSAAGGLLLFVAVATAERLWLGHYSSHG